MSKALQVLMVEDVEQDAALLERELRRGGFEVACERVDTPEAMSAALARQRWDIVISDYALPRFSAPRALALVKERKLDLPFIIVSGTVGEETAVEAIRAGAHDFMAKGRFARLVPAVLRELEDASLRAERAQMQEQLLISDRMASVGTLAAGVAHEINNPLAVMTANLETALRDLARLRQQTRGLDAPPPQAMAGRLSEIEEALEDARECTDRVRHIVRDLKVFSRSEDVRRGPVDVRQVLESSLRLAANEVKHRARVVKDYREVPPVFANEARLGQVFLNLIVNAAQAIPEGRAEENEVRLTTSKDPSGWVQVEVRDTGGGIPEDVLPRVFDPFFTTKPIGIGTGLGLAICHRIVTAQGGQIQIESKVGQGTVVRTLLPAAALAPDLIVPAAVAEANSRRGRILVVDDELMLRKAVERMLAAEHEVVLVGSAAAAMERLTADSRFDVILCDLMMPDMTGMELHAQLRQLAGGPADRMVFMTGGAFTAGAREFLEQSKNLRIEKPFEIAALRAVIEQMLR